MKNKTFNIPIIFDDVIQRLIKKGYLTSRSGVIRDALDDFLDTELGENAALLGCKPAGSGGIADLMIVSGNITDSMQEKIKLLVGKDGIYPSRSEVLRVALREFLLRDLKKLNIKPEPEPVYNDGPETIRVPISKGAKEMKTYTVLRRLEH